MNSVNHIILNKKISYILLSYYYMQNKITHILQDKEIHTLAGSLPKKKSLILNIIIKYREGKGHKGLSNYVHSIF